MGSNIAAAPPAVRSLPTTLGGGRASDRTAVIAGGLRFILRVPVSSRNVSRTYRNRSRLNPGRVGSRRSERVENANVDATRERVLRTPHSTARCEYVAVFPYTGHTSTN